MKLGDASRLEYMRPGEIPDRMPVFAVKEIRQALRSRIFTWSFCIFHLLMPVLLILGAVWGRRQESWMMLAFAAALTVQVATLTRAGSLCQELHGKHYELLCLSPLRSGRMIFQKWLSSLMFAPLFLASAIPYVLMFHFLTRCDPWPMLLVLVGSFFYAAASSALVILCSTLFGTIRDLHLLRMVCSHGASALSLWLLIVIGLEARRDHLDRELLILLGFLPVFSWLFLALAACHLPLPGQVHAGKRRAALLAAMLFCAGLAAPVSYPALIIYPVGLAWILVFLHDFFVHESDPRKPPVAARSWLDLLFSPGRLPAFCFHLSLLLQIAVVVYGIAAVAPPQSAPRSVGMPAFIPPLPQLAAIVAASFLAHPFLALLHLAARERREWRLAQLLLLPGLCLVFFGSVGARPADVNWPEFGHLENLVAFSQQMALALPMTYFPLLMLRFPVPAARRLIYFIAALGLQIAFFAAANHDERRFFVDIGETALPWLCLFSSLTLPVLWMCYQDDCMPRPANTRSES
ncbi:MAG: hypothetical protein RL095_3828 [Verrucomicrobiota bacterium]|jgi:hypothetical protein